MDIFNRHVIAFFKTSDLKEGLISFDLQNANSAMLIPKFQNEPLVYHGSVIFFLIF